MSRRRAALWAGGPLPHPGARRLTKKQRQAQAAAARKRYAAQCGPVTITKADRT